MTKKHIRILTNFIDKNMLLLNSSNVKRYFEAALIHFSCRNSINFSRKKSDNAIFAVLKIFGQDLGAFAIKKPK